MRCNTIKRDYWQIAAVWNGPQTRIDLGEDDPQLEIGDFLEIRAEAFLVSGFVARICYHPVEIDAPRAEYVQDWCEILVTRRAPGPAEYQQQDETPAAVPADTTG